MLKLNGVNKIISAMPGAGKSTLMKIAQQAGIKVKDSDSQKFNFRTNSQGHYIDIHGKVVTQKEDRVKNPNFVQDYTQQIQKDLKENDLVFVAAHEVVRDALHQMKIPFDLVRHDKNIKDEIVERIKNRDSNQPNEIIAKVIDSNWDTWMKTIDKPGPEHIFVLRSGQFLNDIFRLNTENKSLDIHDDVLKAAKEKALEGIAKHSHNP